jgi:hypothetical protein
MAKEHLMGKRFLGLMMIATTALVGCGGDGSSGTGDAGPSDAGDATTAAGPVVLEVTPADGDKGVLTNASIVIRFSRSMNTASVQAAFSSDDFDLAETGVTWNAANDTLTISGAGILEYAEGGSPEEVTANEYSFALATTATDADGNPLEEALSVTFATARHILASPPLVGEMTGTVASYDFADDSLLGAGDDSDGENYHALITFDITDVVEDVLEITQATVGMRQSNVAGEPFSVLGSCYFEHVSFDTFSSAAHATPSLGVITNLANELVYTVDVAENVQSDLDNRVSRDDRSQYRIRFSNLTNGDLVLDVLYILVDSPTLDLRYLIE